MSRRSSYLCSLVLGALSLASTACQPPGTGPSTDSQTNWLKSCSSDSDCGDLGCWCGVCTTTCVDDAACAAAPGSACIPASAADSLVMCPVQAPPVNLCLPMPSTRVSVDSSRRYQRLTGFGATIGYAEDDIAAFPRRAALNQAMFQDLGLDVVRLRNRYDGLDDAQLTKAAELVLAAERSLGRPPLVLLSSWSPPSYLKENGASFCSGDPASCTLRRAGDGSFDYPGLALHWRGSLEAYARAGVTPDYIGIQNNPDWAPDGVITAEACRLLATEGTVDVSSGGVTLAVTYPGYAQALAAVLDAIDDLPERPLVLAPELSGASGTEQYLSALDMSRVDAIAHHLYGQVPEAPDAESLIKLGSLGTSAERPLFQTEMQADGFGTALLLHHALAVEGVSMYLQTALVGPRSGPLANPAALIGLSSDELVLQEPYFALAHYARFTDPGWTRVEAGVSAGELLASAWLSPDEASLTVVVVNAGASELLVSLDAAVQGSAQVTRTAFSEGEHLAELGELPVAAPVRLPARALLTWRVEP